MEGGGDQCSCFQIQPKKSAWYNYHECTISTQVVPTRYFRGCPPPTQLWIHHLSGKVLDAPQMPLLADKLIPNCVSAPSTLPFVPLNLLFIYFMQGKWNKRSGDRGKMFLNYSLGWVLDRDIMVLPIDSIMSKVHKKYSNCKRLLALLLLKGWNL